VQCICVPPDKGRRSADHKNKAAGFSPAAKFAQPISATSLTTLGSRFRRLASWRRSVTASGRSVTSSGRFVGFRRAHARPQWDSGRSGRVTWNGSGARGELHCAQIRERDPIGFRPAALLEVAINLRFFLVSHLRFSV
jgi:hypothetical protein